MRDPQRIDRILEQLRYVWKKYPDLRLMQLLANAVSGDVYYIEDEDLMKKIEETYFKIPESNNE